MAKKRAPPTCTDSPLQSHAPDRHHPSLSLRLSNPTSSICLLSLSLSACACCSLCHLRLATISPYCDIFRFFFFFSYLITFFFVFVCMLYCPPASIQRQKTTSPPPAQVNIIASSLCSSPPLTLIAQSVSNTLRNLFFFSIDKSAQTRSCLSDQEEEQEEGQRKAKTKRWLWLQ